MMNAGASRQSDSAGSGKPEGVFRNPPLQEAIFEARWEVGADTDNPLAGDPDFKILLGRFHDRVSGAYHNRESLPMASMPDVVAAGNVQYRWKAVNASGVFLQIGPGVMTLNHASPSDYHWPGFRDAAESALDLLATSHPGGPAFRPSTLMFRYLNGIRFDSTKGDTYEFLREKLHMDFVPPSAVLPAAVERRARNLQTQSSFMCSRPRGRVTLAFANIYEPEERLMWQIIFDSHAKDVPALVAAHDWLESAHAIIDEIFRNMIRGELERSFA
jgi:uncharacterized protein (TIGR04255 family)